MNIQERTYETFKNKWIVIEGPDRIGKSTLIRNLAYVFKNAGLDVMSNAFPRRQTHIGKLLDKSLKSSHTDRIIDGKTQTLLFLADMLEAHREISKWLEQEPDGVVITDRYIMSTYAYSMAQYSDTISEEWIANALSLVVKPDVFVYLKPKDMCLDFVVKRSGFGGENTERREVQEAVLKHMNNYYEKNRNRVMSIVVDENMTSETISNECVKSLLNYLPCEYR